MRKAIFCLVFFCICMIFVLAGCDSSSKSKLVVGTEATFAPYEYVNGDRIIGIDMDIVSEIARHLGRELVIEDMSFEYLRPALQNKRIDLIISGVTVTEERKNLVDFSEPYSSTSQVVMIRSDSNIRNIRELKGKLVGVQRSTTGDAYVTKNFQPPSRFPNSEVLFQNLFDGKLDATVMDDLPSRMFLKRHKGFCILGQPLTKEYYAIAVRKGDSRLLKAVNTVIRNMKSSGQLDRIREKHERIVTNMKSAPDAAKKEFRVAVDPTFPPFGYIKHGKIDGIETDILNLIANELGMSPHYEQVGFDSLFEAVENDNGIDVGAGTISITKDRAAIVNFTIPYFSSEQYLFVPKTCTASDISQMKGKRIGAIYCSTADKYLRKTFGEPECFSEAELLFKALAEGKIDGAVMDDLPAEVFMKQYKNLKKLPRPLLKESYAFVVRKENLELLNSINKLMFRLQSDGSIRKICEKHFKLFGK